MTRIASVKPHPISVPLKDVLWTAHEELSKSSSVIVVEVRTDDGFVKAGYRAVKLKTGAGSPADEAKRVRAVREAIGKDISLMLDMNAPYDVDDCIEFARRVEPLDIFWLEEPLHWYLQPADFVRLAAATLDTARARRARADALHGARLHRQRRHPLRAVRQHARRGFHRGAARRRAGRAARRS